MRKSTQLHSCRWRRRKEARPGEIIEAALELFVTNGFNATRLDDVARLAGISKGTLYLYFASKEDLFRAVVQQIIIPEVEKAEQQAAHTVNELVAFGGKNTLGKYSQVNGFRSRKFPRTGRILY